MNELHIYFILTFLFSLFSFKFFLSGNNANLLKIYDHPDDYRKIHSKKILKIGGIGILFSSLFILCLYRIINEEEFLKMFKGSPIKRIKRRGLLRNVAVALGNSNNLKAVPFLIKALEDKEPLIRAHVVWALGELIGSKCISILNENLLEEKEFIVLREMEAIQDRFHEKT